MTQAADSPNRSTVGSGIRFLTELIGWTATPWALHRVSWVVAIVALALLIGLPAIFGTPGDRPSDPPVAIPGAAMILIAFLEIAAAAVAPWFAWPVWAAIICTALAVTTIWLELARWRWLMRH